MRLIERSLNHLRRERGKSEIPMRIRGAPPGVLHLYQSNPELFCCAWAGTRLVGFGGALRRGRHWYLAWLFVDPRYQDRGIGRRLLERIWPEGRGGTHSVSTFGYNMQPVGLYSRFGMLPTMTLTMMYAKPDRLRLSPATGLRADSELTRDDWRWIDRLEERIRGFPHPTEWRYWRSRPENRIFLFRDGGRRVGYAMLYRQMELSPVGAVSPRQLRRVTAEAIRLAAQLPEAERAPELRILCPESNRAIYPLLLKSGFRCAEMLLFMTDRLRPDFDRYLPAMLAIF
jgi:GNAT superfamily N-acetyltransferase